jgi:hypothetical protein
MFRTHGLFGVEHAPGDVGVAQVRTPSFLLMLTIKMCHCVNKKRRKCSSAHKKIIVIFQVKNKPFGTENICCFILVLGTDANNISIYQVDLRMVVISA